MHARVRVSGDGQLMAVGTGATLTVVNLRTQESKQLIEAQPPLPNMSRERELELERFGPDAVRVVAFDSTSKWLLASGDDMTVYVWDLSSWQCSQIKLQKKASCGGWAPDGRIVIGDKAGDVFSVSLSAEGQLSEPAFLLGHFSHLSDLTFCRLPEEKGEKYAVVTCDYDEKIRASRYPNCYNVQSFPLGSPSFVSAVAADRVGNLVSGGDGSSVYRWDVSTGALLSSLRLTPEGGTEKPFIITLSYSLTHSLFAAAVFGVSEIPLFTMDGPTSIKRLPGVKLEANQYAAEVYFDDAAARLWVVTSAAVLLCYTRQGGGWVVSGDPDLIQAKLQLSTAGVSTAGICSWRKRDKEVREQKVEERNAKKKQKREQEAQQKEAMEDEDNDDQDDDGGDD